MRIDGGMGSEKEVGTKDGRSQWVGRIVEGLGRWRERAGRRGGGDDWRVRSLRWRL